MIPRPTTNARPRHVRTTPGFALIEVLVALMLLSVGVTAVFVSMRGSLDTVRSATREYQASLILEELLTQMELTGAGPGRRDGDTDDGIFEWTIETVPWEAPLNVADLGLLETTVAVRWTDGRRPGGLEVTRLLPRRRPGGRGQNRPPE